MQASEVMDGDGAQKARGRTIGMRMICGVVRFDGAPVDRSMLERMSAALIFPGLRPQQTFWRGVSAGLAVLDFGRSLAELRRRHSGAVLAADARLVSTGLGSAETQCSTWLDRDDAAELVGLPIDFALADWNAQTRRLVLARDTAGVRPLVYYHDPGNVVAFASFPRALHAVGLPRRQVETASLIREMLGVSRPEETLFTGVEAVRPGAVLTFSAEGMKTQRPSAFSVRAERYTSPQQGAEALREAVTAAVQGRVDSTDGAMATHLSGGLDSSAITVLAARALQPQGRRLLAYSLLPPASGAGQAGSERAFVEDVLQQETSIEWRAFASGDPFRPATKLDRVLSDEADDPENAICAHASAEGASLVLSGWGGDEGATFNGRGALADALMRGRLRYLGHEIQSLRRERGMRLTQIVRGEVLHYLRAGVRTGLRSVLGGDAPSLGRTSTLVRPALLRQAMAGAMVLPEPDADVRGNQHNLMTGRHLELRTANYAEIGARYGVAFSFPLLDPRVLACVRGLERTWHVRDGWKRRPFRDAMEGVLPESIRWRHDKRTPFPGTFARLADRRESLRAEIAKLCERPEIKAIFDVPLVQALANELPDLAALMTDGAAADHLLTMLRWLTYGRFLAQAGKGAQSLPEARG